MSINELKNQVVHMFVGFWVGIFAFYATGSTHSPIPSAIAVGICVEAYQLIIKKEDLKVDDRILDLSSWAAGGIMFFVSRIIYA